MVPDRREEVACRPSENGIQNVAVRRCWCICVRERTISGDLRVKPQSAKLQRARSFSFTQTVPPQSFSISTHKHLPRGVHVEARDRSRMHENTLTKWHYRGDARTGPGVRTRSSSTSTVGSLSGTNTRHEPVEDIEQASVTAATRRLAGPVGVLNRSPTWTEREAQAVPASFCERPATGLRDGISRHLFGPESGTMVRSVCHQARRFRRRSTQVMAEVPSSAEPGPGPVPAARVSCPCPVDVPQVL